MKKILFILTISVFSAALISLIASMIFNAVEGRNSALAVLFAAVSAGLSFFGIIILIMYSRGNRYENK